MKRKQLGWRLIAGMLMAGLIAFGLSPVSAAVSAAAADGPNLALGKAVSASGSHGEYAATHANDGDQGSYWESPSDAFPQWLQIDLDSSVSVDQVVLRLPVSWGARTQTLSVQGSTDGGSFDTLAASAEYDFGPAAASSVTIDLPASSVRYVRVHLTGNTGWPAAQISEFEIYGTDDGGNGDDGGGSQDGSDLAFGKPIEASSTAFSFVAGNANDGDVGTYWESNGYPATLTVRLGADAEINAVVVKLNPDPIWGTRTQGIEVLGRGQGGGAYDSLVGQADYVFNPASNQNTVTIPVTASAADVQLRFVSNTGAPGGQVGEFQVLGVPAPNPDLTVGQLPWTPPAPAENDPLAVNVTVANIGSAPSGRATVDVSIE